MEDGAKIGCDGAMGLASKVRIMTVLHAAGLAPVAAIV